MNGKILNELMGMKKSKKSNYDPLKSMGFGKTKSTPRKKGNDFLGMGYSSKKQKGITDILGPMKGMQHKHIGSHKGHAIVEKKTPNVDLRKLMGFNGHPHPSSILGDKVTSKQKRALSKDPWADWDGDGVVNGLDCDPMNPNKHGFVDKAKNLFKGRGFVENDEAERRQLQRDIERQAEQRTKELESERKRLQEKLERERKEATQKTVEFSEKGTYNKSDAEVRNIYDEERKFEEAQRAMPNRNLSKEQFNKEMDVYTAKMRRDKAYRKVQEGPSAEGGFKEAQENFAEFEIAQSDLKKAAESYNKFDDEISSVQRERQEKEQAEKQKRAEEKESRRIRREEDINFAKEKVTGLLKRYGTNVKEFYKEKAIEAGFSDTKKARKISYTRPLQRLTGYAFADPVERMLAKEEDYLREQERSLSKFGTKSKKVLDDLKAIDEIKEKIGDDAAIIMKKNILAEAERDRLRAIQERKRSEKTQKIEYETYLQSYPIRKEQMKKDFLYAKKLQAESRYNTAKLEYESRRLEELKKRSQQSQMQGSQISNVVDVIREQQGKRVGGLSDYSVLPKYTPELEISKQREERYDPDKPRFVYRAKSDYLGRKDSKLRKTEKAIPYEDSPVRQEARPGNRYPSSKLVRGYERVYVGKGGYVRKGRRRIKPTWDKSKRPKRKFTPYVTTYGTKKAYGQ